MEEDDDESCDAGCIAAIAGSLAGLLCLGLLTCSDGAGERGLFSLADRSSLRLRGGPLHGKSLLLRLPRDHLHAPA